MPDSPVNEKPAWIVLVEDNPADVTLVRQALYEYQVRYQLTVLIDGESAIQLLDRLDQECTRSPDLVLLDVKLPKKGGFDVLARVRASAYCRSVPVVILTSSGAQRDQDTAAKLGVTQYIRKPSRFEDFIQLGKDLKEILVKGSDSPA